MSLLSGLITACFVLFQLGFCQSGFASTLSIISQKKSVSFSTQQLRHFPLTQIEMDYNRAYPGTKMMYTSVRLCDLLKPYRINPAHFLEFIAADHFSVLIPASKILNCKKKGSVAYLAIEPDKKWPVLFNHTNTTAGPYAVIWTYPERASISDEYWAWSVVKIIEHDRVDDSIVISQPAHLPATIKKRVLNGYATYVSHCSSCHTIKQIGKATIGPDLIYPKTIFDYYPDRKQLKQFIRDPQSVRNFPNSRMSGSSYIGLSEADLDDLIYYLDWMVKPHT